MCKSTILNDENISDVKLINKNKAICHTGSTSHLHYVIAKSECRPELFLSSLTGFLSSSRLQLETATSITLPNITENEKELREEEADESENDDQEYEESSSASIIKGLVTKKEILQFLRKRKQRKGRQTNEASDELYEWLFDFYLRRKSGPKCGSIATEPKKFQQQTQKPISRDAVDIIFKLIDTWISCNKNIL